MSRVSSPASAPFVAIFAPRAAGSALRNAPIPCSPARPLRLEPGPHGIGRDHLHAANSALPRMPCLAQLPRARTGPRRTKSQPPRSKRAPVRLKIAAAVLCDPLGRTLLVKDPGAHDSVLFSRMWQFPAVEVRTDAATELQAHLHATLGIEIPSLAPLPSARHAVTFRNITLLPFLARVATLPQRPRSRIVPLANIRALPVSSATRKIASSAESLSDKLIFTSSAETPITLIRSSRNRKPVK